MSATSNNTNARTAIRQHLSNNGGWHTVNEISTPTGYSHSHTRTVCHALADDGVIDRRRNHQKRVIGYDINGRLEVPGGDRQELLRLIRVHGTSDPPSTSVEDLQKHLRDEVADGVVPLDPKLEFRG